MNLQTTKLISGIIREAIEKNNIITKINNIAKNDDLSFEINGIAQQFENYETSSNLAKLISKTFNTSFEAEFIESEFVEAAKYIFKEAEKSGVILGSNI